MKHAATAQRLLDRVAVGGSALCLLHCLGTPLLLLLAPVLSSSFLTSEHFHCGLVVFLLPVSLVALGLGCRRHQNPAVLALGSLGLLGLLAVAGLGPERLGDAGETGATIACGVVLALGHLRNYRLCRHDGCDT